MVYIIYAAVAVTIYLLTPIILSRFTNKEIRHKPALLTASTLFFLSLFIPSPMIQGDDTEFFTHFIGGGIFTGLLWLFIKKNLGWNHPPVIEIILLYLLVSALGVANELFEFAADQLGIISIPPNDTWWDLAANTLGVYAFWVVYKITRAFVNK